MVSIWSWSTTAASNANADSGINYSENQAANTVNDSARVAMKRVAEFLKDIGGTNTTGGTGNAQTLTATSAFIAYADGIVVGFTAGNSNTSAATLNVNAIGAKSIYANGAVLTGGEIVAGGVYVCAYDPALNAAAGGWHLLNPRAASLALTGVSSITVNSASDAFKVTQTGAGNVIVLEDSASADSTPWIYDASGNRIHGHTAALTTILPYDSTAATAAWQMHGTTKATTLMGLSNWSASVDCATYTFTKSRGAVGAYTVVQSGDNLGAISWLGADGTDFAPAAQIRAEVDGTPGNNDMPGRIKFFTSLDGAQTPTLALTIDSSQNSTFAGKVSTPASTTTKAGLSVPAGTAPTSPVDGDMWSDTSGVYWRINGTTRSFNANLWTLSGLTLAAGNMLYATGAGAVTNLAIGTAGQYLKVNSGATAPQWVDPGWSVILAETDLTTGVTTQNFSVDFSTYEEVVVHLDNVSFSSALGANNFNVFTGIAGTTMSGFQRTGDNYIGTTSATADRYGGMYRFYVGNVLLGGSYYPQSGRAENWGYDASAVSLNASSDAMTHGAITTGRPTQIIVSNGGAMTVQNGKIRIVGRRRVF